MTTPDPQAQAYEQMPIDDLVDPEDTTPAIWRGYVMNRATRRQFRYESPANWRQR